MSDFFIQAKNNYIIAKPVVVKDDKPFTVEESRPEQQHLTVMSIGDDVLSCKVGDNILPIGNEHQAFKYEGEQYLVLEDEKVLGVFNAA